MTRLLPIVLLAAVLSACSADVISLPEQPTPTPTLDALADPQAVPVMLRKELGEAVTVRNVVLSGSGFSAEVRDPQTPDNVDRYNYYGGRWDSDPVSMNMSDIEDLDKETFGLGAVDWSVIPELERKALAGLDLEDEEITAVSIDRVSGDPVRIYIGVNGSRGSGALIANGRGGNVEVRRF